MLEHIRWIYIFWSIVPHLLKEKILRVCVLVFFILSEAIFIVSNNWFSFMSFFYFIKTGLTLKWILDKQVEVLTIRFINIFFLSSRALHVKESKNFMSLLKGLSLSFHLNLFNNIFRSTLLFIIFSEGLSLIVEFLAYMMSSN